MSKYRDVLLRFLSEGPEKIFTESPLTGGMVSKRNYPAKPTSVLNDSQIQALAEYLENKKI
jgi:mono/diheme cytochrome c family protein